LLRLNSRAYADHLLQNGIYTACGASLALLLIRIARPRGKFLGKVRVRQRSTDTRDVFVPMQNQGGVLNPHLTIDPPAPGVIVYRFEESFLYPNSSLVNSHIVDYVKEHTRRGKPFSATSVGDRPWNDAGPRKGADDDDTKPILHAVVFDFSGVSNIDTTGIQALVDTRTEVERWADRPVEFHFATILSPWIRRALIAGGFGLGVPAALQGEIAGVVPYREGYADDTIQENERGHDIESSPDDDTKGGRIGHNSTARASIDTLVPQDTPFFQCVSIPRLSSRRADRPFVASTFSLLSVPQSLVRRCSRGRPRPRVEYEKI
jgi:sodium-independent sulfate anion transporter 11